MSSRREASTLPSLSTILADRPISTAGSPSVAMPKAPDVDQELVVRPANVAGTQRRVGDVVIFKTVDQPRLHQLWNAVSPEEFRKAGDVPDG